VKRLLLLATGMMLAVASVGRAGPRATDAPAKPELLWGQAWALHIWGPALGPILKRPEAADALTSILDGSMMSGGGGWFRPSQTRYDWKWLATRHDIDVKGKISRKDWRGPRELFDGLDRDRDGFITAADLDWSSEAAWLRQQAVFKQWFGKLDSNSNGRVSRQEWDAFFKQIAGDKESFTPDQLQQAFDQKGKGGKGGPKKDAKFTALLLKSLLSNELGSPYEGPRVNTEAPDFVLPTPDSKQTIGLAEFRGKKPVVLIFGSFT